MENETLKSWNENADEWIKTLESKRIPSRPFTDKAIVDLLMRLPATKILDCGCGEGWLTRRMAEMGKKSVGIDATLKLIESAKTKSQENFYHLSYEEIIEGEPILESPFDAAVFNFSLYQKSKLDELLKSIRKNISKNGFLIIQTIHPFFLVEQELPYKSQWIADSWKGLSGNFKNGHSWYARTFEDWVSIFIKSELQLHRTIEVTNDEHSPTSVIFVLK